MISIEIMPERESDEIKRKLKEQFGINNIPGTLMRKGKERIFLFQGEITERELEKIDEVVEIERAGIYIGKIFEPTDEIRLSIEGTQILHDQIKTNIYELNSEQDYEKWMNGQELNIQTNLRGIIIIRYRDEFLGSGKASENKIGNFIPKSRRLKIK